MSWSKLPREIRKNIIAHVFAPAVRQKFTPGDPTLPRNLSRPEGLKSKPVCNGLIRRRLRDASLVNKDFANDAKEAFYDQTTFNLYQLKHPFYNYDSGENDEDVLSLFDFRTMMMLASLQTRGTIQRLRLHLHPQDWPDMGIPLRLWLRSIKASIFSSQRLLEVTLVPFLEMKEGIIDFSNTYCRKHTFSQVMALLLDHAETIHFTIKPGNGNTTTICTCKINKIRDVIVKGFLKCYVAQTVELLLDSHDWVSGTTFKLVHNWPRGGATSAAIVGKDLKVTYNRP